MNVEEHGALCNTKGDIHDAIAVYNTESRMSDIDRRTALKIAATVPLASAISWSNVEAQQASIASRSALRAAVIAAQEYEPKFFNAHEWQTVRVLADMVIPSDDRSGSATDAGVPEFIDFMMTDRPEMQTAIRGGLSWLDAQCRTRFSKDFVESGEAERGALLDDIAWPARAQPENSHGVAFFNRFRDLVATGFWSSRIGVDDLGYIGNTYVAEWNGCPPEALRKLGVSYY
jgi:gluconate 2-dehydrogenase gamma chain